MTAKNTFIIKYNKGFHLLRGAILICRSANAYLLMRVRIWSMLLKSVEVDFLPLYRRRYA